MAKKEKVYGCNGCDYITSAERDKELRCTFKDREFNDCYGGNFIYKNGKKKLQWSELNGDKNGKERS